MGKEEIQLFFIGATPVGLAGEDGKPVKNPYSYGISRRHGAVIDLFWSDYQLFAVISIEITAPFSLSKNSSKITFPIDSALIR